MSIKTSYASWQSSHLPKLKAKLSEGDDAENSYRTNAIGIQVNGSTVNLGLLNHLDKLITIPVFKDDNKDQPATDEEREQALESVFKMVADVVKAQKNSDTTVPVSIDISASGFSINKHPEFFTNKGLSPLNHLNVHYLENYTVSQQPLKLNFPGGKYKIPSFISFSQRLEKGLGNTEGMKITYLDESSTSSVMQGQKSFSLNMTTMNDTNTLAFQLGDQLNQGDTVIGVVGGTGFNVGVNKNFNKVTGNFEQISNLECGAGLLNEETLSPFLSPIDIFNLRENPQLKPETFFASGKAGEELGLVRIAQSLRETYKNYNNENDFTEAIGRVLDGINEESDPSSTKNASSLWNFHQLQQNSPQKKKELEELKSRLADEHKPRVDSHLNKPKFKLSNWITDDSFELTNKSIMNRAQNGDGLAIAMVNDFASRWGGFIKNRLDAKGLLQGVNNPKYAITGSHLQHLLKIPSAKTAFAKALSVPEANLINIKKGEMDGMQAILKAKIATARAAV